jgi:uncharacterized Zn-finger protein
MSDRHHPMYPSNGYPPGHWEGGSQHGSDYPASPGGFSPVSYTSSPHSPTHGTHPAFVHHHYSGAYYSASPSYHVGPSSAPPHQTAYSLNHPLPSRANSFGHSHSHSHPSLTQMLSNTRPRSQSQTHPYFSGQPSSHSMAPHHLQSARYSPPIPFAHTISIPTQYPASPSRPFSCDMCPLSFNRQHDLSRHRQTHTGEKPFTCNGGCGKSFTRCALCHHLIPKSHLKSCKKTRRAETTSGTGQVIAPKLNFFSLISLPACQAMWED